MYWRDEADTDVSFIIAKSMSMATLIYNQTLKKLQSQQQRHIDELKR